MNVSRSFPRPRWLDSLSGGPTSPVHPFPNDEGTETCEVTRLDLEGGYGPIEKFMVIVQWLLLIIMTSQYFLYLELKELDNSTIYLPFDLYTFSMTQSK